MATVSCRDAIGWFAGCGPARSHPRPCAAHGDERDAVWVSDFGDNAVFRFGPAHEAFERFHPPRRANEARKQTPANYRNGPRSDRRPWRLSAKSYQAG